MSTVTTDTWIVGCGEAQSAISRDDVSITELAWEAIAARAARRRDRLADVEGARHRQPGFLGRAHDLQHERQRDRRRHLPLRGEGRRRRVPRRSATRSRAIEDGDQHLNVVVAHAKESQGDPHTIELAAFDPYFERALDPDETVIAAFQAQQLYARGTVRRRARRARRRRGAAALLVARRGQRRGRARLAGHRRPAAGARPRAAGRLPPRRSSSADGDTADRLDASARTSSPGRPHAPAPTGASATICVTLRHAGAAMADALDRAGWQLSDLDAIEINAPYAHQHLMVGAALGLGEGDAARGRGSRVTVEGAEVNASGGWLGGSAGSVAGLHAVVSLVAPAARPAAGGRSCTSTTGLAAQSHHVVLLEATVMSPINPVRAAIVATGQTDHGRRFDSSMAELAREAIDRCLESRGLTLRRHRRGRAPATWRCSRASTWSTSCFVGALGALGKPLYKMNTGGTVGASTALACYHLVASGPPQARARRRLPEADRGLDPVGDHHRRRPDLGARGDGRRDRQLRLDGLDLHRRERGHPGAGGQGRGQGPAATPA